ncbi:hypothetical protein [Fructilactobacillus fructivorans]|nr:hypothetical protein [Fructilactobacillus fructivorans]
MNMQSSLQLAEIGKNLAGIKKDLDVIAGNTKDKKITNPVTGKTVNN